MLVAHFPEQGRLLTAYVLGGRAAGVEFAAGGGIDRARDVAAKHDPRPLALRIGDRDGRQQRLGIRMERLAEQFIPRRKLDKRAQVHDADPGA